MQPVSSILQRVSCILQHLARPASYAGFKPPPLSSDPTDPTEDPARSKSGSVITLSSAPASAPARPQASRHRDRVDQRLSNGIVRYIQSSAFLYLVSRVLHSNVKRDPTRLERQGGILYPESRAKRNISQ